MEDENKIVEQENSNFDDDLDKFDEEHQEDEAKCEEVALKPKKTKKTRSAAQVAAFEKARITRAKNCAARKAAKIKPNIIESDEDLEEVIVKKKPKATKKQPKRVAKKKVVYASSSESESESSDEEVIAVVKRRKKPKAKAKPKKPAPKVIYDDELGSSSDEDEGYGGHYIDVPRQPQIFIA